MTTFNGLTRSELQEMLLHHETRMLSELKSEASPFTSIADMLTVAAQHAAIATALRNILADEAEEAAKDLKRRADTTVLGRIVPGGLNWNNGETT